MNSSKYYIIDFDSTFTKVEALDILGEICLEGNPKKDVILQKIVDITNLGMDGKLSFRRSLEDRVELLKANRDHLPELVNRLKKEVSTSFKRNKEFFRNNKDKVFIVSNGFKDFIAPIVDDYGIDEDHVYANEFEFDKEGGIIGFNRDNPLSQDNGKVTLMKQMNLPGDVYVIGDGYNDYQIREAGFASKFYAFTENIERDSILDKADHITPSFDEFLYLNKMNTAISYPKNRINVLLLEGIHPEAFGILEEEGYNVELHAGAMSEEELAEKIKTVSILGIRSKTHVTQKVLDNANRLMAIGAFCIGTNQIELNGCLKKGVAVFNAPYSNTRSVVELAIGQIIMLMRNIPDTSVKMHKGVWNKSAANSNEIRGKKIGLVGYGNIGAQLSVLAEAMGMQVYYYDVQERLALGNVTKCKSLDELLAVSDVISLHVDGRGSNKNIFGNEEFNKMKDGVIFINLSRGHVVDIAALKKNIESGKVRGAAVDVFPEEPRNNKEPFVSELIGLRNLILTPHVGGSTGEAQENIAQFVPSKIIEYVNTGSTTNSVNFPEVQLPSFENAHRLMHIHHNVPGVMAKVNNILASHDINIVGQYLKTNETIGYVITDINKAYNQQLITDLKSIDGTIKFRILY